MSEPTRAILQLAFWEAMGRLNTDQRVHDMDMPYFRITDSLVDGRLPNVLWEHMETALAELREAAGQ